MSTAICKWHSRCGRRPESSLGEAEASEKIRWVLPGRGKRGGVRVIYYWAIAESTIFMLVVYPKSRQDHLTPQQLRVLRKIVKEEFQ
jgi:hypothetical protein